MLDTVISILVLAAIALFGGAYFLFKREQVKQATLMVILGLIAVMNAAIWLIPMNDGSAPIDAATAAAAEE